MRESRSCQRRNQTGETDAITGVAILGVPYDWTGGDLLRWRCVKRLR